MSAFDVILDQVATVPTTVTSIMTLAGTTLFNTDPAKTLTLSGTQDANGRVIDAANGRTQFTVAYNGNLKHAATVLTYSNTADIKPDLSQALFKTTLSINGNFSGISTVGWGATHASTSACVAVAPATTCTTQLVDVLGTELASSGTTGAVVLAITTTAMSPRTFTITAVSTRQNERSANYNITPEYGVSPSTMNLSLTSNGWSAVVPGMIFDPDGNYFTKCTIHNPTSDSTIVDVDLMTAYTGITGTGYYPSVVTVGSKKTAMLTFGEGGYNGIKSYLWDTGTGGASNSVTGTNSLLFSTASTALSNWDKYAVKITMTGTVNTSSSVVNCLQAEPNQGLRVIPVYTESSSSIKQ